MKKKLNKQSDLIIDETKHAVAPTLFQRIKHVLMAVLMGIVFAQVMLFAFRMGSVVIYFLFYPAWCFSYLAGCAILGWIYGDNFVQTLRNKSSEWWDLWRGWF